MSNSKRKPSRNRSRPAQASRRPQSPGRRPPPRKAAPAIAESAPRTWVANHSRGVVIALSRLPQFVVPMAMVVLLVIGLLAPVLVAVVALAVTIAFMGWLAFLSWPVLAPPQRGMRVVALALIAGAAVARLAGWL